MTNGGVYSSFLFTTTIINIFRFTERTRNWAEVQEVFL